MATKKQKKPRGFKPEKGEWFSESDGRFHWEGVNPITGERKKLNRKNIEDLRNRKIEILTAWENEVNLENIEKTIDDVFPLFYETTKKRKIATRRHYFLSYERYIKDKIGGVKIKNFKHEDAVKFFNELYFKRNLSFSTVVKVRDVLNYIFKEAKVRNFLQGNNPVEGAFREIADFDKEARAETGTIIDGAKTKRATKNYQKRKALTIDEEQKYALAIQEHNPFFFPMFMVFFGTGLRVSELCGLRWEDIDLDGGFLTVKRNLLYGDVSLEGEEPNTQFYINSTKNGESRTIPLTPELIEALKQQKEQTENIERNAVCGYNDYVFITQGPGGKSKRRGGYPYSLSIIDAKMKRLPRMLERATGEEFTPFIPHEARHTFSTRMDEFEMRPDVKEYIMGHLSSKTNIEARYNHREMSELIKKEMNAVFEKFSILEGKK